MVSVCGCRRGELSELWAQRAPALRRAAPERGACSDAGINASTTPPTLLTCSCTAMLALSLLIGSWVSDNSGAIAVLGLLAVYLGSSECLMLVRRTRAHPSPACRCSVLLQSAAWRKRGAPVRPPANLPSPSTRDAAPVLCADSPVCVPGPASPGRPQGPARPGLAHLLPAAGGGGKGVLRVVRGLAKLALHCSVLGGGGATPMLGSRSARTMPAHWHHLCRCRRPVPCLRGRCTSQWPRRAQPMIVAAAAAAAVAAEAVAVAAESGLPAATRATAWRLHPSQGSTTPSHPRPSEATALAARSRRLTAAARSMQPCRCRRLCRPGRSRRSSSKSSSSSSSSLGCRRHRCQLHRPWHRCRSRHSSSERSPFWQGAVRHPSCCEPVHSSLGVGCQCNCTDNRRPSGGATPFAPALPSLGCRVSVKMTAAAIRHACSSLVSQTVHMCVWALAHAGVDACALACARRPRGAQGVHHRGARGASPGY